jgi:hypothetical protein
MIEHRLQPTAKSCGQTVLAMLLGCEPDEVIAEVADKRGTSGKQLVAYLRARGWRTEERPRRIGAGEALPPLSIVRVIWNEQRHRTHWILHVAGEFFDPLEHPSSWQAKGGRAMSCIRVEAPP